jgi:cytosine/adenosine deaminase-related metal-dependent hydrolase
MESASGCIYIDGKFVDGSIRFSRGKYAVSKQHNEDADVKGLILPKTVNCHTHLGDAFIEKPGKCTVEELVAPPNGLKHRMLRKVSQEQQVSSMREAISFMAGAGTSHFIDFRECGLEGVRRLLIASLGSGVVPVILGRPESHDVDEISALLSVADGIGMSAISDVEYDFLWQISEHARSSNKIFALHASEVKRENIDKIIGLKPDFLVHMVNSAVSDLEACSSAGVPIVVCPSSNTFFGLKPPIRNMLDADIKVCIGSDNAMLAKSSIIGELQELRRMFPESIVTNEEIMAMAFDNGRKVLNSLPGLRDENGEHPDFFVIEAPVEEPFKSVLEARAENVHQFSRGEVP